MTTTNPIRWRWGVMLLVLVANAWPVTAARAETGAEILDRAQVKGGLIVHLGCGDGQLTTALHGGDQYLVHALSTKSADVEKTRVAIGAANLGGKVSADWFDGHRLPYVDNLVNLVVAEEPGQVSLEEMLRVLCPNGKAYLLRDGQWQWHTKPWPDEIDQWTHYLHGPDNNAVAHDEVIGPPRRLHWLGKPKFARAHEQLASLSACVTAAGRLFYIIDDTPRADIRFPSQWSLVARDAFNGVVLWKRPIPTWLDQLRRFRSGPSGTAFRLVADDDRVYVTLGIDAPVSILDALSGKTLAVCKGTNNTRQILHLDDTLVMLVDTAPQLTAQRDSQIRRGLAPPVGTLAIVAADAATGQIRWRNKIDAFVHPTLAAHDGQLFYQTNSDLVCVDLATGQSKWRTSMELDLAGHELGWESPTLVVGDGVVFGADFKRIVACSAATGEVLWRGACKAGYNSPPDLFVARGLIWTKGQTMIGRDLKTGEVKTELPAIRGYMHHRCYRNKATDRFFLLGDQGVQFVDLESGEDRLHHWIRGTCQYGIMPANGLLYITPDSCACNMKSKLAGLWALAPAARQTGPDRDLPDQRLQHGPAFSQVQPTGTAPSENTDWPVYRHDSARSGLTRASVPAQFAPIWQADLGGRLSGVTAAEGKVFVASVDTHTVHALDAESGEIVWSYTTGGRIDSPPTLYKGMALFGSADGWVYALRSTDGQLVWRFRAAPEDQRTFVNGQLESVWPVHGSVIVHQGRLIVTAGRSSYLDGGIRIYQLEPNTGELLDQTTMYSPDPETLKQPEAVDRKDVRGALTDILLATGDDVYMRHVKLDLKTGRETGTGLHLFSPVGLLDDTWWHRGYWLFNDTFISHWSGWWKIGNLVPSGRIMSCDETTLFGYGRDKYPSGNTGQWRGGEKYQLFACDRPTTTSAPAPRQGPKSKGKGRAGGKGRTRDKAMQQPAPVGPNYRWQEHVPMYVRAMVVADKTMFIAGPLEFAAAQGVGEESLNLKDPTAALDAWNGKKGSLMWAVSTETGEKLAEFTLDGAPIFDGMAATAGRLYLVMQDGSLRCFGAPR